MAHPPDDRILVEMPAIRRRRLIILGIVVIAVSAAVVADRSDGVVGLVIGLLGLVFSGPVTLLFLLRGIRNRPVLILDAEGFTDHGSLISAGRVSWKDVQRIDERPVRRRVFVTVTVNNREAFRARQSVWHRILLRINGPTAGGDIFIPDNVLSIGPAELVKTMRRLHRAAQRGAPGGSGSRRA